jgi:hypothetical protein
MPRYVGRARRKKMMKASETIDRLRSEAGRGRWSGAREIRRWRDGILLRLEQTTGDMAGWGAKKAKPSQMKRLLERIRAEDS